MKKNKIFSIILVFILTVIMVGCGKPTGKETIYIEIKDPITGEYISNKDNFYGVHWQWDIDNLPSDKEPSVRFKAGKKEIALPRLTSVDDYIKELGYNIRDYPKVIGSHEIQVYVNTGLGKYSNKDYIGTTFDVYIMIDGKANIPGDTTILVEHDLNYESSTFNSPLKYYKFKAPQDGTYKFETIDNNINREKAFFVTTKMGQNDAIIKENSNDLELTIELKAGEEHTLCIGPKDVTDLFGYVMHSVDTEYCLRITKIV